MLESIVEVDRLVSASREPHGVAVRGNDAWIASRTARRIDVMQREGWKKVGETATPGMPWGMNFDGGAILATIPFRARSLEWDGNIFWTNHREAGRTVTFTLHS